MLTFSKTRVGKFIASSLFFVSAVILKHHIVFEYYCTKASLMTVPSLKEFERDFETVKAGTIAEYQDLNKFSGGGSKRLIDISKYKYIVAVILVIVLTAITNQAEELVIKSFLLPAMFSIKSGCYLIICIAGPFLVSWQKNK